MDTFHNGAILKMAENGTFAHPCNCRRPAKATSKKVYIDADARVREKDKALVVSSTIDLISTIIAVLGFSIMLLRGLFLIHSFVISFTGISPTHAAPASEPEPASPEYQWQKSLSNTPTDWQKYVRAPSSNVVTPVRIVSNMTEGNVTNPDGLLSPGSGPTILTRTAPSNTTYALGPNPPNTTPVIVVDFGQNVAGYLSIKFAGASNSTPGLPGIRLAFSETIQYGYLTNVSDFSRSDNGDTITPGSDQVSFLDVNETFKIANHVIKRLLFN